MLAAALAAVADGENYLPVQCLECYHLKHVFEISSLSDHVFFNPRCRFTRSIQSLGLSNPSLVRGETSVPAEAAGSSFCAADAQILFPASHCGGPSSRGNYMVRMMRVLKSGQLGTYAHVLLTLHHNA